MYLIRTVVLFTFFIACSFAQELQLSQEERNFIQEHPVLRVQNERSWAPIDFIENGQAKGYGVDYINLVAAKAGFKLDFISGRSWSSYLSMLEEKQLDIISSMKRTQQREYYSNFSEVPIIELYKGVLQRRDTDPISSMQALKGKTVAVLKGYSQEEKLRLHFPDIKIILAESKLEAMRLVMNKQADASIDYHGVHQYNISKYFFSQLHSIPLKKDKYFTSVSHYIAMRNDLPLLKSIIDKSMKVLSEKEIHELREKWLGNTYEKHIQLDTHERLYLQNKRTINFCADPDWLPVEKIEAEKHIGISSDYLREISKNLNLQFKLIPTASWEESLRFVQTKKCDFLSSVIRTKEREKFLNFSSVYLKMPLVITTRSDTFYVHNLKNLKNKKIGIVKNYAYQDLLLRDYPKANIVFVSNAYEGLKEVERGTIYAYVDILEATSEQLRTSSFSDLKVAGRLVEEISLSLGVRKDNVILFDIIEKGLNTISTEQKKEIYDKWVYVTIEEGIDSALVWKFLLGLGLIILFFLYRYSVTVRHNNQLLSINEELEKLNNQLEELSQTDQLTKLSNRRHLDNILTLELKRAKRFHSKLCVILLDIDFFKKVNDTCGHQTGDEVLKAIAAILQKNSRQIDTVGRWGGEEFLMILSQTNLVQAGILAEKIRQKITEHNFGLDYPLTASFGVAELDIYKDDESSLLSRVDANLYTAKESGRNRVISS